MVVSLVLRRTSPVRLHWIGSITVVCLVMIAVNACSYAAKRALTPPQRISLIDRNSPYVKAHMPDGTMYLLSEWRVNPATQKMSGQGTLYNAERDKLSAGQFDIDISSVAVFETNVIQETGSVAYVMIAPSIILSAVCITSPKTCFGSCPTFYAWDGENDALMAEGFSASIAPVLEARDVDALSRLVPVDGKVSLRMTNEALETHVVRRADLLAAERKPGIQTVATDENEFYGVSEIVAPLKANAATGDCLDKLVEADGAEWFSRADSTDLATKEWITLEFPATTGDDLGLVISSRQTLMTTYLLYQTLAYMGSSTGWWLAHMESLGPRAVTYTENLLGYLGGIEVQVDDGNGWRSVGETNEVGPLATDTRLVPLGKIDSELRSVRLRLTQGYWRIDQVALARIGDQVEPSRIRPTHVMREGKPDERAREALLDPDSTLTTMPGDEYTLVYNLPDRHSKYDLFLDSRGYYYEWIRQEWLEEEDPNGVAMMLFETDRAMRELAPDFKRVEAGAEQSFWGSRYAR
jgi:hypothetical protein